MKNQYEIRIEEQLKLMHKPDISQSSKESIMGTLIWLYQEHVKELKCDIQNYEDRYIDGEGKHKIIEEVKHEISKVLDKL